MSAKRWIAVATTMVVALTITSSAWAVTAPYSEDFESEPTCGASCATVCALSTSGWTNDSADDRDWLVDSGGTTSSATGPDADHNPGTNNGHYLYTETSSPCAGQMGIANLISPPLDVAGTVLPVANFWYHQFGADIGELHVDVLDSAMNVLQLDVIPAIVGGNVNAWMHTANVDLAPYIAMNTVHIRIRAIHSGGGYKGDQAIDDFVFFDNNNPNVAVANIGPNSCGLGNAETITVDVTNTGGAAAANVAVSYTLNGGTPVNEVIAAIATGATVQYSFATTADLSAPGPYTLAVSATAAGDTDLSDNNGVINGFNGVPFPAGPFLEDFEGANIAMQWLAGGDNSDWALGTPAKPIINSAASGANAWITNLTANYAHDQQSQVATSCGADFSALMDPVVRLHVWWNSESGYDGAALQSSIDNGVSWQTVGGVGSGLNWYTDGGIGGGPGGQPAGWTGRDFSNDGSGGWVTAQHGLASLGGEANVKFRIAFGSDFSVADDGFAFDDFEIVSNATLPAQALLNAGPALRAPDLGGVQQGAMVATQSLDIGGSGTVGLGSITVTNSGNIADAEITWHVFMDNGDGVFSPSSDTFLAMQAQANGAATIAVMAPVPYGTISRYHIVAQLDPAATLGATFGSEITAATDISFMGAPALTDNLTYPVTGISSEVIELITTLPYVDDMSMQSPQIAGRTSAGNIFPTGTANGPISFTAPTNNDASLTFEASNGALMPVSGTGFITFGYPNGSANAAIQHAFDLSAYHVATDILWFELRQADRGSDNAGTDHVFLSTDGGNGWDVSLYKFDYSAQADDTWGVETLDVSAALAAAGLDYSAQTVVRVQAADTLSSEFAFVDSVKLGIAPRIAVDRNMSVIADGAIDMVPAVLAQTQMLTYTITNTGHYDLDISGGVATLNETNVSNVVITPPSATVLMPGANDTVTITFDPSEGAYSFDVEVTALDPHLGDDTFTLSVNGTADAPVVDLDVQRPAASSIADGGVDPQGTIVFGVMQSLSYTVENFGNIDASITGVSIVNASNSTASVTVSPAMTLAPAATTTFDVSYQADAAGAFSFDIVMASDDPDEGMYTITVNGTADDGMGTGGAGGASTSSTSSSSSGSGGGGGGGDDIDAGGGCGCRTAAGHGRPAAGWLVLLGLGLMVTRRRRRRG